MRWRGVTVDDECGERTYFHRETCPVINEKAIPCQVPEESQRERCFWHSTQPEQPPPPPSCNVSSFILLNFERNECMNPTQTTAQRSSDEFRFD
jgi:hypothetical protein